MPYAFSIKISDFIGIFRAIAEKANINGGDTLEGEEISIFYQAQQTIDKNQSIFTFDNKVYNSKGIEVTNTKQQNMLVDWEEIIPPKIDLLNEAKNAKALKDVESYIKSRNIDIENFTTKKQHEEFVNELANSWANKFPAAKSEGIEAFKQFIEEIYKFVDEQNITKLNDETYNEVNGINKSVSYDKTKYNCKKDQIVDEMLANFAQESRFENNAISSDKKFFGIFQFSEVGMQEIKNKGSQLPHLSMQMFMKQTKLQQLKYMIEYVKVCRKYYSKNEGEDISASQIRAIWKSPTRGRITKANKMILSSITEAKNKINERGSIKQD